MNMLVVRTKSSTIMIDAGIGFVPLQPYGINVCAPNSDQIRSEFGSFDALLLTHGHEDHIGAIPFIWDLIEGPVYGTRLTLALVQRRLDQYGIAINDRLTPITEESRVTISDLEIEFIPVDHSIPDSAAIVVKSPVGSIVHTGDFKFDQYPPTETDTTVSKLTQLGHDGVLAMFSDSTNASIPGRTGSELELQPSIEQLCQSARGRVFVTTFASSVRRIQLLIDIAHRTGRSVIVLGRGIAQNIDIAERLGYISIPPQLRKPRSVLQTQQSRNILCIVSGSQGEPYAALSRIARNTHSDVAIEADDTVIFSTRIIPGNELAIAQLKNDLAQAGASLFDNSSDLVHVSGHGSQDDLLTMMALLKPKYLIPIHGQFQDLKHHAALAENAGIKPILARNGDRIFFDQTKYWLGDSIPVETNYIDNDLSIPVSSHTVMERRSLAKNGVLVVVLRIDRNNRKIDQKPTLITYGVLTENSNSACVDGLAKAVHGVLDSALTAENGDPETLVTEVIPDLQHLAKKHFGNAPVILPVLLEN
tara:strand:- start:1867 stop:3465 length:1599 start_codon:yes stop_codon:yes gene_type:complete